MAEDTHDQGTPSALRPRPGWAKSAQNPEAVHATLDLTAVSSTGYTDPSYRPPKLSPHSDAGEFDQSPFKEAQQGHRLARAASPSSTRGGIGGGPHAASDGFAVPEMEGAALADGRPAWDSRFFLERSAWEVQPRTMLLRPPSTNAFPGSSIHRSSLPVDTGRSTFSDLSRNPRFHRASGPGGLDGETTVGSRAFGYTIDSTDGNGTRTTILPGLNVAAPPLWASPYGEVSSPGVPGGRNATSPGSLPGPGAGQPAANPAGTGTGTTRPPRADWMDSYVGQAYSPDQSYYRGGSISGGGGDGSSGSRRRAADADGDGGVDGHGTHLPALERAGYGKTKANSQTAKEDAQAAAAAKASAQKAAIQALGAVYLPPGAKLRAAATGSSGSDSLQDTSRSGRQVAAAPPLYARNCRSTDDMRRANSVDAGGYGGGGGGRDTSPGANGGIGGIWRPSGRQPIPETAPPVPKNRQSASGEVKETQEESDRRRAAPRDPSIYSPERYPLVGMGWFMPPEKIPPNPAYAAVKAKYLDSRPPRPDEDSDKTPCMPDIHTKPWLTPGKHLVTDSSTPPPKMTGPAGARPAYSFFPSATGTSMTATSTQRSNKGTARSGRGGARIAGGRGGGGGGGGRARGGRRKRGSSGSADGSGSEADAGSDVDGDREVLAVIGGVRLMSIVRRGDMADEARLEAEEDELMAREDAEAENAGRRNQQQQPNEERGGSADAAAERSSSELEASSSRSQTRSNRAGEAQHGKAAAVSSDGQGDYGRRGSHSSRRSSGSGGMNSRGMGGGGGFGSAVAAGSVRKEDDDGDGADAVDRRLAVGRGGQSGEEDEERAAAKAGGLRQDQLDREEELGGGGYEGADDGGDGAPGDDDDNDGVTAAAAMAGLRDGDGDADGEEEEAEEEDDGDGGDA